jgi:hypothetical protein
MTQTNLQHLSEEELDDVLIGTGSAESEMHLASCERCRAQIAPFQASVAIFNQGSLDWAQAKSNTVTRDLSKARLSATRTHPIAWGTGVAMVLAVGFAIGGGMHREPLTAAPAVEVAAVDNADQIEADNAMLAAINSAISTPAPAPLRPFHAVAVRSEQSRVSEVSN